MKDKIKKDAAEPSKKGRKPSKLTLGIIIGVVAAAIIALVIGLLVHFDVIPSSSVKYLELNYNNAIVLKGEYVNIEDEFDEVRYTETEKETINIMAEKLNIKPEHYLLLCTLTNKDAALFDDVTKAREALDRLETDFNAKIETIYKNKCDSEAYIDIVFRAKLAEKKEFSKKTLKIPAKFKGQKVDSIGISGFYGCQAEVIKIADGITDIGTNAFTACKAKEIYFSDTIKTIGTSAFNNCQSLEVIHCNHMDDIKFNPNNQVVKDLIRSDEDLG